MTTKAAVLALVQELEGDARELARVARLNARAWERIQTGAGDPLDWGALGFTLHLAYGILENYFLRVCKFFENDLPSDRWHRALVERMALDIPAVRPPLLTDPGDKCAALELLGFRHRFRNLYGEDLDPGKTAAIQRTAAAFWDRFAQAHRVYAAKLTAIAEAL